MKVRATILVLGLLTAIPHAEDASIRWESMGGPLGGAHRAIVVEGGRLLLLDSGGQWSRTRDRGTTWEDPRQEMHPWVTGASDRELYADGPDGTFRSSNFAGSWKRCQPLPVNRAAGNIPTSIAAGEHRVSVSVFRVGLFMSDDRCVHWVKRKTPWTVFSSFSVLFVSGPRVIVKASGGTFLSADEGMTWSRLDDRLPGSHTFTKTCDGSILAGASRGAFQSDDGGESWRRIGLDGRWVPAIASPRCNEIFAAVQDVGHWTHSILRSTDGGVTWTAANVGLSGDRVTEMAAINGTTFTTVGAGLFRWSAAGSWQQVGPAAIAVHSVVPTPWGDVLAGGGHLGLFRLPLGKQPWRQLLFGPEAHTSAHEPLGKDPYVLTVTPSGALLAVTQQGVLRSDDRANTWHSTGLVRTVHALVSTVDAAILAGTDNGIFRSTDDGETWVERSEGLTTFWVQSFANGPDGTVYAGTREGTVFRSANSGERWRPLTRPPASGPATALLILKNGQLLSGGNWGLSRWNPADQQWQSVPLPGRSVDVLVRALAMDSHGVVYAGTERHGVFASLDDGATWRAVNEGLTQTKVLSLAMGADGRMLAGTSAGVFRAN